MCEKGAASGWLGQKKASDFGEVLQLLPAGPLLGLGKVLLVGLVVVLVLLVAWWRWWC